MCPAHIRLSAVCCFAVVFWTGIAGAAAADEQNGANVQSAYQQAVAPVTRLQVSGSGEHLSVDFERADVQSTLKAVMKQAGRQFVPDATVAGLVTLQLTDQPLQTVLRAVCEGCYIKYTNTAGIYRFTRDDDAVKNAFSKLNQLNAQLRAQLRALGLDVPADEQFGTARFRVQPGGEGGGFGGAAPTARDDAKQDITPESTLQNRGGGPAAQSAASTKTSDALAANGARRSAVPLGSIKKEAVSGNANIHAYLVPPGEVNQILGLTGRNSLGAGQDIRSLVLQNNFVWFNIPEEKPEPVASVLLLFSQQSNVPILVDQSIPSSLKFRVWGSLSPRQLPEALNVLAPTAHLQWRWIGNTIFIVPAPNFQVGFGDAGTFRSQYPAPSRTENSGQAAGKRGGSD